MASDQMTHNAPAKAVELLPCAYCGNDGIIVEGDNGFSIVCEDPCCAPDGWLNIEEAAEKWNRRTPTPASTPVGEGVTETMVDALRREIEPHLTQEYEGGIDWRAALEAAERARGKAPTSS